jgi:lysophospholipase L1-like esterase
MSSPLPNPIKILVKGASTVGWFSGMGGPRSDFGFPRAMEEALLQAGRPVELRTITVPSERTRTAVQRWEHEMIGYSPDVVVLAYGHYETVHLLLPWWLERHANSRVVPPRRWSTLYRTRVLRPIWMSLAKLQARLDTRIDPTFRRRHTKVVADLEKIIIHTQELHSPLVFLWQYNPPATRYRSWFPGMARRIEVMNEALADLVDRINLPNVRLFDAAGLVEKYCDGELDVATPDGFHYTPELHRRLGEDLAREVAEWADTQPHLQIETKRSRPRSVRPSERAG